MTRKLTGIISIAGLLTLMSCLKANTDCQFSPCQFVAPAVEIQNVSTYLSSNGITATQHCSGMFYSIASAGTGKSPDGCSFVNVKYTGRTTANVIFDQRTSPLLVNLNQVITGWRAGIPLIKEGGIITLYVPPYLGYGNQDLRDQNGNIIVPGNSILIFDVELSSVQ